MLFAYVPSQEFAEFDSKSGWNCSPCCTSVVGEREKGRDGVKSHPVLEEEEEEEGGAKRKGEVLFGGRERRREEEETK